MPIHKTEPAVQENRQPRQRRADEDRAARPA